MKKEEHYIQVFMGTTYDFGKPETVGELKSILEEILADLPKDKTLKISEVALHGGKLDYTLAQGISQ